MRTMGDQTCGCILLFCDSLGNCRFTNVSRFGTGVQGLAEHVPQTVLGGRLSAIVRHRRPVRGPAVASLDRPIGCAWIAAPSASALFGVVRLARSGPCWAPCLVLVGSRSLGKVLGGRLLPVIAHEPGRPLTPSLALGGPARIGWRKRVRFFGDCGASRWALAGVACYMQGVRRRPCSRPNPGVPRVALRVARLLALAMGDRLVMGSCWRSLGVEPLVTMRSVCSAASV